VAPRPSKTTRAREVESLTIWKGGYPAGLKEASNIGDRLSGDDLAPYPALWNYFSGCTAYAFYRKVGGEELKRAAGERFLLASQAVRAVPMFARPAHELSCKAETEPDLPISTGSVCIIVAGFRISPIFYSLPSRLIAWTLVYSGSGVALPSGLSARLPSIRPSCLRPRLETMGICHLEVIPCTFRRTVELRADKSEFD
jgi:hypothetical protein